MFYLATINLISVLAPTISGYIISTSPWPVQMWWTVGVGGFVALLAFLFLQETTYSRSGEEISRKPPRSWLSNRKATFLPGNQIVLESRQPKMSPWSAVIIGLCPITILGGILLMVDFGLVVAQTDLLAVFLQSPVSAGGYGFTPSQNASFQFSQWFGIFASMAYGYFVNDRLPLWICRRRNGIWRLEYRLFPALPPAILVLPVALGLFGACLQYHLHYMVSALATFLSVMAVDSLTTVVVSYLVESFTGFAQETTTVLVFYRLILGIVVPFFVDSWESRMGLGWMFGMQAFLSLFCSTIILIIIWRGPAIRRWSFSRFRSTDEGVDLIKASGRG